VIFEDGIVSVSAGVVFEDDDDVDIDVGLKNRSFGKYTISNSLKNNSLFAKNNDTSSSPSI